MGVAKISAAFRVPVAMADPPPRITDQELYPENLDMSTDIF